MTTVGQNTLQTGDYPIQSTTGGYYVGDWPYPYPYSPPYWNPPVYVYPSYLPPLQTVIVMPDTELKEEIKGLKAEVKKLRKELNAHRKVDLRKRPVE